MEPKAETHSLIRRPLPNELDGTEYDYGVVEKAHVLTVITIIDEEMDKHKAIINYLQEQRTHLIHVAVDENITSDDTAVLYETLGKAMRNPISDIEHFKTTFPQGYKAIRAQQKTDLKSEYDRCKENLETSTIPLTLADKIVGKEVVTEFVGTKPQLITYEVRKRPRSLKP